MTKPLNIADHPHRRFNPLIGQWLLVSPHRAKRPWQGDVEDPAPEHRPSYDPKCYLCPGNVRAGGEQNPDYQGTYVFPNDFSALLPEELGPPDQGSPLMRAAPVRGEARVVCYSPRHDLTLAQFTEEQARGVVEVWCDQAQELNQRYRAVVIFENKGGIMGCSNPHPHGQIWAMDTLPNELHRENLNQAAWQAEHGTVLLKDYLRLEMELGERLVLENDAWVVLVPFWALWPFETLLLPKKRTARLEDLDPGQRDDLARIMKRLAIRYDNLFKTTFPFSMGWHTAPGKGGEASHWHLHAHYYPPLLRSATVRKFMVGFEMLGEPQRDITPEQAAQRLRDLPDVRWTEI